MIQVTQTVLTFLPEFALMLSSEKKEDKDEEDQEEGHRNSDQSLQVSFQS